MRLLGRDREKFALELLAFADVHRKNLVRQPGFLEEDRDLVAVWCGPVMQVDHGQARSLDGCVALSWASSVGR